MDSYLPSFLELGQENRSSRSLVTEDGKESHPTTRSWIPPIQRPFLGLVFASLLILIGTALVVLDILSEKENGFSIPSHGVILVFTYCPTVVFIFIGWVMDTYVLEAKKMSSWSAMKRGRVPADASILLDNISPSLVSVIRSTLKRRDWPVVIAALGSLSATVAAVFATSIFSQVDVSLSQSIPLLYTQSPSQIQFNSSSVDHMPIERYLGHAAYGLSSPSWQGDGYVLASFNRTIPLANSSITAVTTMYQGTLSCEQAEVVRSSTGASIVNSNIIVSQNGCQTNVDVSGADIDGQGPCPVEETVYNTVVMASQSVSMSCNDSIANNTLTALVLIPRGSGCVINVTALLCDASATGTPVTTSSSSAGANDISVLGAVGPPIPVELNTSHQIIPWLDEWSLNDLSLSYAIPNAASAETQDSTWSALLSGLYNMSTDAFFDTDKWIQTSEDLFREIWPYIVQPSTAEMEFSGSATIMSPRLVMSTFSASAVAACSYLMALCVLALVLLRPSTHVPRDPSSLAFTVSNLATSMHLNKILTRRGSADAEELAGVLQYHTFSTSTEPVNHIEVERSQEDPSDEDEKEAVLDTDEIESKIAKGCSWRPLVLHPLFLGGLCILCLLLLIVLELVYRLFVSHDIVYDGNHFYSHYAWRYIPPAILMVIGLGLNALNRNIYTIDAFAMLSTGLHPADKVITYSPLYHTPVTIFWHTIIHRRYIALTSTLTIIFVHLMKITVSGLFYPTTSPFTTTAEVAMNQTFALGNQSLDALMSLPVGDFAMNYAFNTLALVTLPQFDVQSPQWVVDGYALSSLGDITSIADNTTSSSSSSILNLTVPVVYADLTNCYIPSYNASFIITADSAGTPWPISTFTINDPCFASETDNHVDWNTTISVYHGYVALPGPDAGSCNSKVAFAFFKFLGLSPMPANNSKLEASVFACDTALVSSMMNASVATSNTTGYSVLGVDPSTETGRFEHNSSSNLLKVYNGAGWSDSEVPFLNGLGNDTTTSFDTFFSMLTLQDPEVPLESFLNDSYLRAAVKVQWLQLWSLYADRSLRSAANGSTAIGTLRYDRPRVTMHPTSTRILQGFLGAVALCVGILGVWVPTKNILPAAPYTIASRMSLLAGSRLLMLPAVQDGRLQTASNKEVRTAFKGYWIGLGWWEDDQGRMYYGIDLGIAGEREPRRWCRDLKPTQTLKEEADESENATLLQ